MRTLPHVTLFLPVLLSISPGAWAGPDDSGEPLTLVVELTDGSTIRGTARIGALSLVATYGKIELATKEVAAITFNDDRETVRVSLANGDHLQGALKLEAFKLRTVLGEVSVPMSKVARIAASRGPAPTVLSDAELLAWLSKDLEIPNEIRDERGNPVRGGRDLLTGLPLEVRHKKTGIHFVFITTGKFLMGSPEDEPDRWDRENLHVVRITKPFYLAKYEVTQPAWEAITGRNPSKFKDERNPVEMINWNDCQEFIKKLSEARNEAGGKGEFGLPTEAQWEYACRAGSQTRYYFGEDETRLDTCAWYEENSGDQTHPVGQKRPNAWGLYDMYGNVGEWCADWYGPYPTAEQTDPTGPTSGTMRVSRSFGLNVPKGWVRSAMRGKNSPDDRHHGHGARLILSIPKELH